MVQYPPLWPLIKTPEFLINSPLFYNGAVTRPPGAYLYPTPTLISVRQHLIPTFLRIHLFPQHHHHHRKLVPWARDRKLTATEFVLFLAREQKLLFRVLDQNQHADLELIMLEGIRNDRFQSISGSDLFDALFRQPKKIWKRHKLGKFVLVFRC